jgi:hypothetical protein
MANFEVDPTVMVSTRQLVLINEFCWDICDFDADILRIGHWGIEVEVLEVDGAEFRTFRDRTLLSRNLKSSRDAVLVPTSPG